MSRAVDGRVILSGGIVFSELLHIGGTASAAGFDAPPVVDGLGRYIIPGTSLIGVVRSWFENSGLANRWSPDVIREVFGNIGEGKDSQSGLSVTGAALLSIDDVVLADVDAEIIDGVGIDRYSGAAANGVKFDRTALRQKSETAIPFRLVCDFGGRSTRTVVEEIVRVLAAGLHHGQLRIGSSTARGFGAFRLHGTNGSGVPKMGVQVLDREGVLARIGGRTKLDLIKEIEPIADGSIELTVSLKSLTSTFVKNSIEGTLVDTLPRVAPRSGEAVIVIPATSIKGVIRSEVERIERTIRETEVTVGQEHHQQVRTSSADALFGFTAAEPEDVSSGTRGAVRFGDMYGRLRTAQGYLSWESWERVQSDCTSPKKNPAGDRKKLMESLRRAGLEDWQPTEHVAIDRWTSGAAPQKLFSVLEPYGVEWDDLTISIDGRHLERNSSSVLAALAGLFLALQALHEGAIGLGWGTHRGHGSVQVTKISVAGVEGHKSVDLDGITSADHLVRLLESAAPGLTASMRDAWKGAVA